MPFFIPDLTVILTFGLASLLLALTPGPDMALFLSRAINYGRPHGYAALFGACTGLLLHSALAALGISILIAAAPTAFLVLKIVGAVYLLWLAFNALRANGGLTLSAAARTAPSLGQSYLTGLGINLLNPKIILFFVTFLPQFVDRHDPAAGGKLLFLGLEFILVSLPPTLAMIFVADRIARLLIQKAWVGKVLNYSFAGVFAAFALSILFIEGRR